SACLELQDPNVPSKLRLGAHMVIPQDDSVYNKALEIVDHDRRVEMTYYDGTTKDLKDTYVIMLVGNSGRYVDAIRTNADPTWFTPWQLRRLGRVIKGVCKYMVDRYSEINYNRCITPEDQYGVHFNHQDTSPNYRWGDIPDYDTSIFWEY